jgi:hypothetical protein
MYRSRCIAHMFIMLQTCVVCCIRQLILLVVTLLQGVNELTA